MAPLITHLVIGERVFPQIPQLDPIPEVYGAFLLGCVLVDVSSFEPVDRRETHFVGRLDEDGADAFSKSCANFGRQLGGLLRRPWHRLARDEQGFAAGYMCHLAADESWKAFAWRLMRALGITSWRQFPVPPAVVLTAFGVLSSHMFLDLGAVAATVQRVSVPDVLTHVPHDAFQRMWEVVAPHVLDGAAPESFFELLARQGKSGAEIRLARRQHARYWDQALDLIRQAGGIQDYTQAAVEHSVREVSRLWV